jgi:hypothetical protein
MLFNTRNASLTPTTVVLALMLSAISGLAFFVDQFNDRVHIVNFKRYFSRPKTSRHKYLR